ncbi:lysophospholipid acyltransferase family protein [Flavobacterium sp. RHBU_3]|uniref:lysophospholipid acyltransferase family protein n=1 Tax=Flavobacterium sp. RHBU_3 TaxID=3391184 RepID=UPI003984F2E9
MQRLAYILAYPVIWFISILPFPVLYLLSDMVYVLVYYVIGYRKKTVRKNFRLALPHLTPQEMHVLEKRFYHHFCDNFLEMIKTLSITDKEINERFVFTNFDVIEELEREGKSVSLLIGHYASYEWLLVMHTRLEGYKGYGIYKPIKNKYFDHLVKKMRSRFNAELLSVKEVIPNMRQNNREGQKGFYGFITDQSPLKKSAVHWGNFFGMEVPIQIGGEMLSKKLGLNMAYAKVEKIKRGYYQCTFVKIEGDLKKIPNYDITDGFMRMLEEQILKEPAYYLWTHKRFKHRRN